MEENQAVVTEEELAQVGVSAEQEIDVSVAQEVIPNVIDEKKAAEEHGFITAEELDSFFASTKRDAATAVTSDLSSVAAEERQLANELDTTRLDVRTNLEARRKAAEKRKIEMELEEAPSLTSFLTDRPGDAPILRDGIHDLATIERAYAAKKLARYGVALSQSMDEIGYEYETPELELSANAVNGWQAAREDVIDNAIIGAQGGYATVQQGLLWAKLRDGQIERDEAFNKQSKEYDETIKHSQENSSWIAAGAEFLGIMAGVMTQAPDAQTAAVVGGMAAAASATGVGAVGSAGLLGAMWLAGSAKSMYNLEGGLAYKDMVEAGTDESVARDTSRLVGFTNAMIEVVGLKLVGKAFSPALKMLISKNSSRVAQGLAEPTMKAILGQAAIGLGKSATAEVGTELVQEMINVAGEQVAREYGKANFNEFNSDEIFDRLYDVANRTFKGVAVLGGLGLGPTIVAGARKVHRAETVREHYMQVSMGLQNSQVAHQSPEVVAEAIQSMEDHYDSGNYYIDADELRQVCIAKGISTDELRQVMPQLADNLEKKAVNKEDVEVPAGEFLTKVSPTPLGEALANHVRKNQEDLSYNDAMKLRAEVSKDMRAVMTKDGVDEEAIDKGVKELKSEKFRQVFKDLSERNYQGLLARNEDTEKKFTEQEMRTQAKWGAWLAVNLARRANLNPEDVMTFAPSVESYSPSRPASFDDAVTQSLLTDPWKKAFIEAKTIIEFVLNGNNTHGKTYVETLPVTDELVNDLKALGFKGDVEGYSHAIYDSDLKHILDEHGEGNETSKDQIPLTKADLLRLPIVVGDYDTVELARDSDRGNLRIKYTRVFDDGVAYVVEEVRKKKRVLATQTAYKKNVSGLRATSGKVASRIRPKRAEIDRSFDDILELFGDSYNQKQENSETSRGSYSKSANRVMLTPNADLSTFAHEMGHWYLEALFSIYDRNGVSATVREDVEVMLKDFGLKSVEEWNALSRDKREVLHERFAFYVEQYLATGEAPTRQTRGFFSRLGKWIRDVYKQLNGDPQAELEKHYEDRFGISLPPMSDEVRRVLDRMVASEQQIKTAEMAEGIQPLFESKPDDMSDEQWAEYVAYLDESEGEAVDKYLARVSRDERWYANARSRVLKKIEKNAAEVRQKVRDKVEKQVNDSPISKIFEAMKSEGIRIFENDLVALGFGERRINILRRHGLLVKYNEENRKKYPSSTLATVRQWAAFAKKYSSNKEFVLDLLKITQREKLIDELTTEQCLKDHAEFFNEKERNDFVSNILHNEARGRALATELSYLARDNINSRVVREAAKIAAERIVSKEKVGKVSVKRYLAAETRAARKAFECLKSNDRIGAIAAKRAQLVNHEAALLAIEAEKRVKRISALKSRIFKSDKNIAKTHDTGILAIARYVMTNMGIGKGSPSQGRSGDADVYLEKLKKYDEEKYAAFSSMLDKYSYRGDIEFKELPYETAMELLDDVQSLYRMAREAKQLLLEGRKIDREAVVDELLATFNSVPRDNFDGGKTRAISESQKAKWNLMSIKAKLMRVENWCRAMDRESSGPFFRYIFAPVANAAAKFRNENAQMQKALLDIIKPMQDAWANVREIDAREIGYVFATKAELIGALLHTGNQSNKNKMLLGGRGKDNRWATMRELPDGSTYVDTTNWDSFVNRCIDEGIITKADMDAVQAIWDLNESIKGVAQKAFVSLYGHYFEEVEATPITTKWGVYRGGYVPAITEKYMVPERKTFDEIERVTEQEFVSQMPVHEPGFSKSRVPSYTEPLALDVGLICGHVQQVLKFAHIAPVAHEVAKILNDRRFREAISSHNSSWIPDMLLPWLKRSYTQTVSEGEVNAVSSGFNELRGLAGMNIMIGHFVNALQQTTGLSIAATKVKPKYLARGFESLMKRKETLEFITEASPFMKARLNDRAMEFQSEIEKIVSKSESFKQAEGFFNKASALDAKLDPARDFMFRKGYFLQVAMQAPIDSIVWVGAYQQAIDNGLTYEDAVNEADSVVRTTQSDFSPENMAKAEVGGVLYRSVLVFYNYFGMQLNLLGEKWEGAKYTKKYKSFAYDSMLIVSIPSIISGILAQLAMGFDTGDDDDWDVYDALRLFLAEPVKNVIAMIPFVGAAVNTGGTMAANLDVPIAKFIWGEDPYQAKLLGAPSADMVTNALKAVGQLYKAGIEGEDVNARSTVRNTIDLVSVMTRMPLGFLKKPLGYIAAVENREEHPRDAIDYARGLITGRGQD